MLRNCDVCNQEYNAETRYLNRGQGLTCSRACGTILAQRLRTVKNIKSPNTECSWCHTPIWKKPSQLSKGETFFCSRDHMLLAVKAGLLKVGPESTKVPLFCVSCNKPIASGLKCRYCRSHENQISSWLAGDNNVTLTRSRTTGLPADTKKFVKKYLIDTRGDQCELCEFRGINPHTNNSIIQMDHIDGNCFNNSPENLQLLCPNCHSMTPNYGSLNRGSGRAHRRKNQYSVVKSS